jgi:hypothetical protein
MLSLYYSRLDIFRYKIIVRYNKTLIRFNVAQYGKY